MTPSFWRDRRVLVTGHTGFKGAWLCAWLDALGAKVTGLSLPAEGSPNLWSELRLTSVRSEVIDINDAPGIARVLADAQPEVIFHLAAQSLVRRSYRSPVETFSTNVTGVVTLLDAVTRTPSVRAVVIATSDKCYENFERDAPYAEDDRFGGRDPYSASKGAAEIAAAAMRASFFAPHRAGGHPAQIATVRAGNVIGGGDWSEDRLVPDIIRGCLGSDGRVTLRAPRSIRPWQHVLEPLRGYIMLAEHLFANSGFGQGWNFGPDRRDERQVIEAAEGLVRYLGAGQIVIDEDPSALHEAKILRLDAAKAAALLGWHPVLDFNATLAMTAYWYARHKAGEAAATLCATQIADYMQKAGVSP